MTIGDIRSNYRKQKQYRNENDQKVATSWESSLFYSKDVKNTEQFLSIIDNGINAIRSNISAIRNKINTKLKTSFHNTRYSLGRVKIPESITANIRKQIKTASKNAWEKYKGLYESNLAFIDSNLDQVKSKIDEYDKLNREIDSLGREIAFKRNSTLNNDISSLEAEQERCEKRQKDIIKICNDLLSGTKMINDKNVTDLLSKGLAKA